MNIRIALPAMVCLLAITLPATAQTQTDTLTLVQILTAAQTANPETGVSGAATGERARRVRLCLGSLGRAARSVGRTATVGTGTAQRSSGDGARTAGHSQAYVHLQQANEDVSLLEERLRLAQLDLQLTNARVEVGATGATQQLQAEVAALTADLNLASARNQRRFNTLPNLVEKSGLEVGALDAAVLASEPPELPELGTSDSYSDATARRVEQRHAAQQLQIDQINLDLLSAEETSRLDLETATNTVESSKAALENTALDLQTATASAFATAQQAYGTVTLRELQLALQQERTRRTEEQFSAGMITQSDLDGSQADLIAAINTLRAARWSAWFAWLRLQDAAGLELPGME